LSILHYLLCCTVLLFKSLIEKSLVLASLILHSQAEITWLVHGVVLKLMLWLVNILPMTVGSRLCVYCIYNTFMIYIWIPAETYIMVFCHVFHSLIISVCACMGLSCVYPPTVTYLLSVSPPRIAAQCCMVLHVAFASEQPPSHPPPARHLAARIVVEQRALVPYITLTGYNAPACSN